MNDFTFIARWKQWELHKTDKGAASDFENAVREIATEYGCSSTEIRLFLSNARREGLSRREAVSAMRESYGAVRGGMGVSSKHRNHPSAGA